MRVLVTGGAGFIGSAFVRRLAAQGDDGRRPRQADVRGQSREPRRRRARVPPGRHRRPGRRRGALQPAATRSSTSRPRRTSTARSSARPSSSSRTSSARRCCSTTRAVTAFAIVQVSTDEVYGDIPFGAPACGRGRADSRLEPVLGVEGRRRPAGARVRAHVRRRTRSITRGANTYGARQYPEKFLPLFITNALDGVHAAGVRRRAPAPRVAAGRRPLRRDRDRAPPRAAAGEVYNVGGQERENMEVVRRILDLTGASPDLVRHVDRPPGPRPPLRRRLVEAARSRLDAAAFVRRAAGSRRRSTGTARTATGGSRSSPVTTAATTTSSTRRGSAVADSVKRTRGPRGGSLP